MLFNSYLKINKSKLILISLVQRNKYIVTFKTKEKTTFQHLIGGGRNLFDLPMTIGFTEDLGYNKNWVAAFALGLETLECRALLHSISYI